MAQSTATLKQSKNIEMKTLNTKKVEVAKVESGSDDEDSVDRSAATEAYLN